MCWDGEHWEQDRDCPPYPDDDSTGSAGTSRSGDLSVGAILGIVMAVGFVVVMLSFCWYKRYGENAKQWMASTFSLNGTNVNTHHSLTGSHPGDTNDKSVSLLSDTNTGIQLEAQAPAYHTVTVATQPAQPVPRSELTSF